VSTSGIEHGNVLTAGQISEVSAGRVTTLEHGGDNIASIRVIEGPQFGNLTVNPDNTLALVLSHSQQTGQISFSYEVSYEDGSAETFGKTLNVVAGEQHGGWGDGEYYLLEEDADGNLVIEHGDVHREVYISKSADALSAQDIAALEGLDPGQITSSWLAAHPEYGGDPSTALRPDIGMDLWRDITNDGPNSHWLLFEGGHTYTQNDIGGLLINRGTEGESELHPVVITTYGEGERPVFEFDIEMYGREDQTASTSSSRACRSNPSPGSFGARTSSSTM
jgi:hypothetical protein